MTNLEDRGRGRETDYVLGTALGWDAFGVVRWHGVEALDSLFEYEILLVREAERGPVDVEPLVDTGASFAIATAARWRLIHGIVSEAELVDQTATQLLYRVVLAPHFARARHRLRCRTFVEQPLEQIISSVLENRAPKHPMGLRGLAPLTGEPTPPDAQPSFAAFREPAAFFRWALSDPDRVKVPKRFVVQFNESDFDFVSRMLESEGISYFFEQASQGSVLTLSDRPGHAPLFQRDETHELVGAIVTGHAREQEVVRAFRAGKRMRPALVTMRDFAWRKSLTAIEASAEGPDATELEHFEFPARDEDDPTAPAKAPAQFQLERFEAERTLSTGFSTVRTLEPGYRFRLADRAGLRDPAELLLVSVESFAVQHSVTGTVLEGERFGLRPRAADETFFENRFEALPAAVRHRPARRTGKPRIFGVHSARVTAEELAKDSPPPELNSDELGRVRVRFPWDQRPNDGTPTSKWIRVAQYWAGPGFGALYVPRVGHEVLVAFEQGDPDRPVIVGRLYNAQNPPPYVEPNTTKSTIKSDSVGSDGSSADGFNELRFEDAAGKEQVFLHAQRDLDEVVRANHSTSVGGFQSNSVGGNQTNSVHGSREHTVRGTELVEVFGNRSTIFHTNEAHVVGVNRDTSIGAQESHKVGGNRTTEIGANDTLSVTANYNRGVVGNDTIGVSGERSVSVHGIHRQHTDAHFESSAAGFHKFSSTAASFTEMTSFTVTVGGASLEVRDGLIVLNNGAGASIALCGADVFVSGSNVSNLAGSSVLLKSGGPVQIGASGDLNAKAATIKLNE